MDAPIIVDNRTTLLSRDLDDYPGGVVIVVNKPYLWTSADVIRKIRVAASRHFALRKLKVGHAGTLDPLATGVLLVCIGNATKLAQQLQSHDKEYIAGINFGATTPSYDLEQDIDREFPYGHITEEAVVEALRGFIGEQEQVAPLFSAKSVEGVRAYEIARKIYKQQGREGGLDAAANDLIHTARIVISEAELLNFLPATVSPDNVSAEEEKGDGDNHENEAQDYTGQKNSDKKLRTIHVADVSQRDFPNATVRIVCSKGTYIRAFARDLGEALNTGAYLSSLQRSRSGDFTITRALSIPDLISLLAQ